MLSHKDTTHIAYRRDIDGLRALAVIAVVIYHAFPKILKGGFVGVDIFFVISGYLISSIIYKNLEGGFNFYDFYARRIKRIFPALILVLLACIAFGWLVLTAEEYIQIGRHVRASTFFYMNFALLNEAGYFDNSAISKPLLHLWSLSIEEQFYIVWPLLLWFSYKKGINQISLYCLLIFLSFLLNMRVTAQDASMAFYLSPCRFWELMCGGMLAYLSINKIVVIEKLKPQIDYWLSRIIYNHHDTTYESKDLITLKNVASIIGFLLCVYSIIFLKKTSNFPGKWVLYPVIGTILIIAAGPNSWANKSILSSRIMVWFGLISYPLYLWHWPILSYAHILEGGILKTKVIGGALTLSVLLGWLTYRLIEKPVRTLKTNKFILYFLSCTLILISLTGHLIYRQKGYPQRYANSGILPRMDSIDNDQYYSVLTSQKIDCKKVLKRFLANKEGYKYCKTNSEKPRFIVIGDSHADNFTINALYNNTVDILRLWSPGHLPFVNYINYPRSLNQEMTIKQRQEIANSYDLLQYLQDAGLENTKYVILHARGPVYVSGQDFKIIRPEFLEDSNIEYISNQNKIESIAAGFSRSNEEAFIEGYVETINLFLAMGKKVIFSIDFPELGFDPKTCLRRPLTITYNYNSECSIKREFADIRRKEYLNLVEEIKRRVPALFVYDPINIFCDSQKCYGKKQEILLYVDNNHINYFASGLVFDDFLKWLEKNNLR